jgi:hypothetical protein
MKDIKDSTQFHPVSVRTFVIPLYYGSGSGSGTVINYGSGSDFLARHGSGSVSQKVTVPVPQRCLDLGQLELEALAQFLVCGGPIAASGLPRDVVFLGLLVGRLLQRVAVLRNVDQLHQLGNILVVGLHIHYRMIRKKMKYSRNIDSVNCQ